MKLKLSVGRMAVPIKTVIYGPEGIGKSTFASKFPAPIFIDTEGSTRHMNVTRIDPAPAGWAELLEIIRELSSSSYAGGYDTLVLDTADWAEMMCARHLCQSRGVTGIEDFGYGKGYTYLAEEFAKLLVLLDGVWKSGHNVVVTAHAAMRKFEQPDELGAYDRWELKLQKKTAPLLKEWADMVLFANYKTIVVNVDNQGAAKGKNKVQGGSRVMYTSHHPCWDAKNRFGLPEEMPLERLVREGKRVLVLAHRAELLTQATDKLAHATGLKCAVEKAEQTCMGSWFRVVVGSVQTLCREKRLSQFDARYFDAIIIDEAHHCLSDSYQTVLSHFPEALVLGVTATPDRGDMRNLGEYFDALAYEYTITKAIREGYLCPIKAQTIPLRLDIRGVETQSGDYAAGQLGHALEPYLEGIAQEMARICMGRRTVVFLPLVATSQKMQAILNAHGLRAAEVNGESADRAQTLEAFARGEYDVLCNSMLLTEGWDCPAVDCVVVLRATKVRSLYCQMVGRGTRLASGKEDLLLLDFLWNTEKHELCRPACLICESPDVAQKMTENLEALAEEEDGQLAIDLEEAEARAQEDVIAAREEALARKLEEMKKRKRRLVDPLQFEMSIQAEDLSGYVPAFGWEAGPPTDKQRATLEKLGIFPDEIENAGKATLLLNRLNKRRMDGLTTPKQIRFLESRGFEHVGTWPFESAKKLIDRIAANGWHVPHGINPREYTPELVQTGFEWNG